MKNYWLLTRVMVRNMMASMNPFTGTYENAQKRTKAIFRAAMIALLALGAIGSVIYIEYLIYQGLNYVQLPKMLPGLAIFASVMFTLVLGLFQGLSELFQGKDAPFLAVLPLTSRQVFAARMTTLYLSELGMDALICVPAFVLYAVGCGSAWPVALTGLPVLLLLPLIPLSVVALLASLLMKVSFFARHRESVVMFLSVVLALAYSITMTLSNTSDSDPGQLVAMLVSENGLANKLLGIFPPAQWAMDGLLGNVPIFLLFLAVSVAAPCAVIALVGHGYLDTALTSTEHTVVRRKTGKGAVSWKSGSAFQALHTLEWKEILRTPAWAYNALLGIVMFPLMIGIGFIAGISKAGEDGIEGLRPLLAEVDPCYVGLVAAGVMMFGCMVNPAVSTAISREGGRWPFALTLPVRQQVRFRAKLAVGVEINVVCAVMIAVVLWFIVRMEMWVLLAALAIALLIGLASAAFSLWVDALRPQLVWASEMEAIKKNFNQVIGMLIWVVQVALCVVPAVFLWEKGGAVTLAAVAGVAVVETAVSLLLLSRVTEKHVTLQA